MSAAEMTRGEYLAERAMRGGGFTTPLIEEGRYQADVAAGRIEPDLTVEQLQAKHSDQELFIPADVLRNRAPDVEGHICDTPTAYLVTEADPGTDEWFEARRGGITGTDLPKILGDVDVDAPDRDKRYGNSLSVWLDKRGELPGDEVGEAADWGHLLEDIVAQEWARREEVTVSTIGVIANIDHPHRRASLDRTVHGCPLAGDDECGLEVKTRSAYKAGSFVEDIPDDVLAQVAWGRLVSGFDHMHVAVLIGGQQMRSFLYERDDVLEQFLIAEAEKVWQHVIDGERPEVDPDRDGVMLDLLNLLYPDREGIAELEADEAQKWLDQYDEGHDIESEGSALKTQAKTALVELAGDARDAEIDGRTVFTYRRPKPSAKMPAAEMVRLRKQKPETYAELEADGYIVTSQGGPRFSKK